MAKFIQQEMPDRNNTGKKQTYYPMDVKRNIDTTKDDMNLPRSLGVYSSILYSTVDYS